jgi:hypothetical protein
MLVNNNGFDEKRTIYLYRWVVRAILIETADLAQTHLLIRLTITRALDI